MTATVRHLRPITDAATARTEAALDPARDAVRGVVQNLAVTRYGGRVGERPVPGFEFPPADVDPVAGLRAARFVRQGAERAVAAYVAAARADGLGWVEIARTVGLTAPGGEVSVFADAAGSVYGHITYRCRTCGGLVDDYGPDAGPPSETVDGHLVECPHAP